MNRKLNRRGAETQNIFRGIAKVLFLFFLLSVSARVRDAQAQEHDHDHEHRAGSGGNPKTAKLWEKSDQAFHDGKYELAVGYHRQIVEIDPKDVESWSVAAWLIWSMGKKETALSHIARGLKVNGQDWNMWDAAGQHYQLQAGMRDTNIELMKQAKEAFARAVQLFPADVDKNDAMMLRRRLAHAAEKSGDMELSLATWKKLVEDYPDDQVNKNNLARIERSIAEKQSEGTRTAMAYAAGGAAFLALIGSGAVLRRRAHERVSNSVATSRIMNA